MCVSVKINITNNLYLPLLVHFCNSSWCIFKMGKDRILELYLVPLNLYKCRTLQGPWPPFPQVYCAALEILHK